MAERLQIEANLRSEFGFQRLSRGEVNQLSRISLLPRESASEVDGYTVRWREGDFWLDFRGEGRLVGSRWEPPPAPRSQKLVTGETFAIGKTTVSFECSVKRWPVDLERERELLARNDDAGWTIYADELLTRGDPLGAVLAKAEEFDLAFHLDIRPLLARQQVAFIEGRSLWREITFRPAPYEDTFEDDYSVYEHLDAGQIQAVLTHPRAWFARRVTIEVPESYWEHHAAAVRRLGTEVSRTAGPFFELLSLPNFPQGQPLPASREGVRVDRG